MSSSYFGLVSINKKQQEELVHIYGVGKDSGTEVKVPAVFTSVRSANKLKATLPKENTYEVRKVTLEWKV